ncbi:Zinc finger protein 37 [Folsomia candida]|uniref:Zinc finger protein 37 n=3 Tax=Folsomia candida TaxID=158441 RepID=A0A226CW18_FOLCA|nr:Zinc finger protein 37 [Folsomia candida]OXA36942.1 Zinc finger protein 37 [Folsomia candida]OXA40144.1 Zinc finger protein 37 [Folsomia candida]
MGTHRTERPFPCPHCARAFKTGGRLGQHVRDSHTPGYVIPTHKCPQCRKEFRFRNKLDAHIRAIHTGERPFTCDQCGKGFVINSALRLHLRGAHGVALESKDRLRRSKKRVVQRGDEEVTT